MNAVNRRLRTDMRLRFREGTMEKAKTAAQAGATEDEVKEILKAGAEVECGESVEEIVVPSLIQLMVSHPLGGAL